MKPRIKQTSPMTKYPGFTLLELLIVLVIIGLSSSITMPDLWHSYEKAQEKNTIQQFAQSLTQYHLKAYQLGKTIEISQEPPLNESERYKKLPNLPQGWKIKANKTLRFLPSGVTNGAKYIINSPQRKWQLTITALDGKYEIQAL